MPGGGLHVKDRLLNAVKEVEILFKDRFDFQQTSKDLRSSLASKVWHFRLVSLMTPRKEDLALTDLNECRTDVRHILT